MVTWLWRHNCQKRQYLGNDKTYQCQTWWAGNYQQNLCFWNHNFFEKIFKKILKFFLIFFWFFFDFFSDFFKISVFSLKRLEIYRNLLQWKIFCEKVKFEKFLLRGLYRHLENFRKNSKFYIFGLNWSEICRNLFSWKNFCKRIKN